MSSPIFNTRVATSALGESFGGQTASFLTRNHMNSVGLNPINNWSLMPGVGPVGGLWDDIVGAVTPAITQIVKGGVQLGQQALQNLAVKGQRRLGVEDSGKVYVDPTSGKAYPIVTQNGSIFLRDEFGNLTAYTNSTGYVTTQSDILGNVQKYGPWVVGAVGLGVLIWFVARKRR